MTVPPTSGGPVERVSPLAPRVAREDGRATALDHSGPDRIAVAGRIGQAERR